MKKFIFTLSMLLLPAFSYAQEVDLVSGITHTKQDYESENEQVESEKEKSSEDKGVFSFLNFSFIKKDNPSNKEKSAEMQKNQLFSRKKWCIINSLSIKNIF